MKKKLLALSLTSLMLAQYIPVYAEETAPSEKEEVVYIMLDSQGSVKSVNTVNIFEKGEVVDYGDYSEVKNLTGTETINTNGDEITYTANEKSYYQGTNKSKEIPWNINVDYYLDGKKYSGSQLAGKSGSLEIQIDISKNEAFEGDFYDNYALQASLTLDTNKCENIETDGATVANVGENKQISYTILPGKGLSTTIKADVEDFEMSAIEINGVQLSLNVDIDDEELMDKVTELMDATKKLNDGSQELKSNSSTLEDGSKSLKEGIASLNSGSSQLDAGVSELSDGMSQVQSGLDTLNEQSSTLTNGSSQIHAALDTLNQKVSQTSMSTDQLTQLLQASSDIKTAISNATDGASELQAAVSLEAMAAQGLDYDSLTSANTQSISALQTMIDTLKAQEAQLTDPQQIAAIEQQIYALTTVQQTLTADNSAIDGTKAYITAVNASASQLTTGLSTLNTSYEQFDASLNTLVSTLSDLASSMQELSDAINTLDEKYKEFDVGVNSYTSGVQQLKDGYSQLMSGVSSLASGSKQLLDGSNSATQGANDLYSGIVEYCDGVEQLSDGTEELYTQTDGMDTKIQEQIDEILDSLSGNNTEVVSFVSSKNTNVDAVQFVIKTDPIEKEEVKEVEETTDEPSFLDKIKGLFD